MGAGAGNGGGVRRKERAARPRQGSGAVGRAAPSPADRRPREGWGARRAAYSAGEGVWGGGSFTLLLSICASRDLLGSKVSVGLRRHRSGGHVTAACPQQRFVGALGQKEDASPSFVSAIVIDLSQH